VEIDQLSQCTGFEWDEGNFEKNWIRHKVSHLECEQVFLNHPFVVADDAEHSEIERRYYTLGQTDRGRRLFVVFTVRGRLIRVISARDMSRAERSIYDEKSDSEERE
jgi:uncharacterized protein